MITISNASMQFLKEYVFNELNICELTDNNQEEVVEFISKKFEDPLSNAVVHGEHINEELLRIASRAITEITSDW